MSIRNLFSEIRVNLPEETVDSLLSKPGIRIERIVSYGHVSPPEFWYDQPQAEFVVLLQGKAQLRLDDRVIELEPGSFVDIPAHQRHRVEWTDPEQPTIWLAIHYTDL